MAWPITRSDGDTITATIWNAIVSALSTWGGATDAGGYALNNISSVTIGDPTVDGSWQITTSGSDLVVQRRESGSWVTVQTISAS